MPIRGIIFDGFSTLIETPNLFCGTEVADYLLSTYHWPVDPEHINYGITKYWGVAQAGRIGDATRWRGILRNFGHLPQPSDQQIHDCILIEMDVVKRDCLLLPDAIETLKRIQTKLPIALCSNATLIHAWLETELGLRQIFGAGFIISCEYQSSKDYPGIFRRAAQSIGLKPQDCLYVDDGPSHLAMAKSLGMTPVFAYTTPETREKVDLDQFMTAMKLSPTQVILTLLDLITSVLPAAGITI